MNTLMNASPAVQNTVAIAAIGIGIVTIVALATTLGRKWHKEDLEGKRRASRITLNNLYK